MIIFRGLMNDILDENLWNFLFFVLRTHILGTC